MTQIATSIHTMSSMDNLEIWKPVVGYEGVYQVSDLGRVKRIARGKGATPGRLLKPQRNRSGYLAVNLSYRGKRKSYEVHRLVALAFIDPSPGKAQVNHKNGVRTDNGVSNLEWVTRSENAKHAYRVLGVKPRRPHGERSARAKLTDADVLELRHLYSTGNYTQKELGARFGITQTTVSSIIHGKTWGHLPCDRLPRQVKTQHGSKLTVMQVKTIRQLYDTGNYTHRSLAKQFGVSRTTIASIIKRETWRHI